MAISTHLKKARQFLYNVKNAKKRRFYTDLMFPRDDYHLRYFGHQFGRLPREDIRTIFPNIKTVKEVTLLKTFDLEPGTSLETSELVDLIAIATVIHAKNMIEIGTFNGNATLNLAANLPDGHITTVDLPENRGGTADIPKKDQNVADPGIIGSCFKGTPYEKNISQVLSDSMELDWNIFGKMFDLVFIDGCHHETYVRKDTENAMKYVNDAGVIVWHDYGQSEGVSKAVDDVARELEIHAIWGTRFAVGRKR